MTEGYQFERLLIVPTGSPGDFDWSLTDPKRIRDVGEERPFWLFNQSSGSRLFETRAKGTIQAGDICLFHRSGKEIDSMAIQFYALGRVDTVAHDPEACAKLRKQTRGNGSDGERKHGAMVYHLQLAKLVPVQWTNGWLTHTLGLSGNDNPSKPRIINLKDIATRPVSTSIPGVHQRIQEALASDDIMQPGAQLPQVPPLMSQPAAGPSRPPKTGLGIGKGRLWRPNVRADSTDGDEGGETTDSDVSDEGKQGLDDSQTVVDGGEEDGPFFMDWQQQERSHGGEATAPKRKMRLAGGASAQEDAEALPTARPPKKAATGRQPQGSQPPKSPSHKSNGARKYGSFADLTPRISGAAAAALQQAGVQLVRSAAAAPGLFLYVGEDKAPARVRGRTVSKFVDVWQGVCASFTEVRKILDPEHPAVQAVAKLAQNAAPQSAPPPPAVGLFAAVRIPKATIIGEITGQLCSQAELAQLQDRLALEGGHPARTFELLSCKAWGASALYVVSQPDHAARVDLMGCINDYHTTFDSSGTEDGDDWPNATQLEVLHVTEDKVAVPRLFVQTIHEVDIGEEITMDLGPHFWNRLAQARQLPHRMSCEPELSAVCEPAPPAAPQGMRIDRPEPPAIPVMDPRATTLAAPRYEPRPGVDEACCARVPEHLDPARLSVDAMRQRPEEFVKQYAALWQMLHAQLRSLSILQGELGRKQEESQQKTREIGHLRALLKASWQDSADP